MSGHSDLLLKSLLDESRSQRETQTQLTEALSRTTLEIERLSVRVHQLHTDLAVIQQLSERVTVIERERAAEQTRGKVYASIGAAIAAAIGAVAGIVAPWFLSRVP